MCDTLAEAEALIAGWMERKIQFKRLVKSGKSIDEIRAEFFDLHKNVHFSAIYGGGETICDFIWKGLTQSVFSALPIKKHMTIGWCFWHLYRIEDMISNILIAEQNQIFDKGWQRRINSGITDTANALSYSEAVQMSERMNMSELREYCIEVGKNTGKIVNSLGIDDLKKKPKERDLNRIVEEGGLVQNENSIWLKDYWGGRTIGGLLTVPLTDHHMMHLPGCIEIKKAMQTN